MIGIQQTTESTMTAEIYCDADISKVIELFKESVDDFKLRRLELNETETGEFHELKIHFTHTIHIKGNE